MPARHKRSSDVQMLSTTLAGDWDEALKAGPFLWIQIPQATTVATVNIDPAEKTTHQRCPTPSPELVQP
jgi:hypothetical protein